MGNWSYDPAFITPNKNWYGPTLQYCLGWLVIQWPLWNWGRFGRIPSTIWERNRGWPCLAVTANGRLGKCCEQKDKEWQGLEHPPKIISIQSGQWRIDVAGLSVSLCKLKAPRGLLSQCGILLVISNHKMLNHLNALHHSQCILFLP